MSCAVMPLKSHQDISYRIKCVDVVRERVFGDLYVTAHQTSGGTTDHSADGYQFPALYKKRGSNLISRTLHGPDLMELNRKPPAPAKRNSLAPVTGSPIGKRSGRRTKSVGDQVSGFGLDYGEKAGTDRIVRKPKVYPAPFLKSSEKREVVVSSLVDQLLLDIYGLPDRGRSESDSTATASSLALDRPHHQHLQKARLLLKSVDELRVMLLNLREHINHTGGMLVRQLRRKDYLATKRERQCDIITAHLQAYSVKRVEDTKMRFSLTPQPGESGFVQWLDAMKMVARLQGGIPPEFRKRLWLTLAERHLEQRGVDWKQAEKVCFNEWSNPDDEELGIQIVKDLHRTGCSLFCGAAGRDNQAVLRRVLLGFARWNKSVGYCQGLNVLAALVLQVMDRAESAAVKVMIYLIEGVLPEGYFADNLRGLSVDMAVFRDLLRGRLPKLSKHLEALQNDSKDKPSGSSYEPPLTNVFTMQWFLTLFCHCLPQEAVLRVWDLIFLEGDEILLRTALVIWEGLSDRIMTVTSADEFYSIMGVLTREMLEFTDTNNLIKNIVSMGPLHGVTGLREKHRYNITPWARKLSDDDDSDTEEDERLAVAAAMFSMAQRLKKDRMPSTMSALQAMAPSSDRERLALDISTLKQHYAKLRERQRQAHIILSAACARQSMVPPPTSQAMNHLLVGKNALVSGKNRPLSLPSGIAAQKTRPGTVHSPRSQNRKDRQGVTLHWKDTKKTKQKLGSPTDTGKTSVTVQSQQEPSNDLASPKRNSGDSDSDSTSTELCDEPDRLSDLDSEDLTSASESYVIATDDDRKSRMDGSPVPETRLDRSVGDDKPEKVASKQETVKVTTPEDMQTLEDISIARITDQIRRLSAEDDNNTVVPHVAKLYSERSPDEIPVKEVSETRGLVGDASYLGESLRLPVDLDEVKEEKDSAVDYIMDASILRKSLVLDEFDYLSYNSVNSRRDEVLVHERHRPRETTRDERVEISVLVQDSLKDEKLDESFVTSTRRELEMPKYSGASETKYNKDTLSLDANKEKLHETFKLTDSVPKRKEDSEKSNNLTDSSSESLSTDRKFYPKVYMGHLPISPITVDQKLSKLNKVSSLNPQRPTGSEIKLESLTLSDRSPRRQTKSFIESKKKSPKTPESGKSFSSGETMGPDSRSSSLTVSPRTPIRSESKDFHVDKSSCSSVSSESKTLVLHSTNSDLTKESPRTDTRKTSYEKSNTSTPMSTDSLRNKSDSSPKLAVSSSSESCSPGKLKSSERSISSDLQSPISANSIKYTTNYSKRGQDDTSQSSNDLNAVTSPFYPIANPNRKTPSPYDLVAKQKPNVNTNDQLSEGKPGASKDLSTFLGYRHTSSKSVDTRDIGSYVYVKPQFSVSKDNLAGNACEGTFEKEFGFYHSTGSDYYQKNKDYDDDPSSEKDVVPSLPQEKIDKQYLAYNYRRTRHLERSSSSLESRFSDLKSSTSTDEFATSVAKKRSSDILEDIKHLEAKAMTDGTPDTSMLTKKTSYMWEDLKSLEARRQDTFSNSASNFSKRRLEIPDVNVVGEARKSYVVRPKINIDENSDSILGIVTRCKKENIADDEKESKIGVWTKVKPGKNGNNGRRSSERALKIIQENSVILHKILACQARKRLSDLEEMSKEITISPINEEISKIFSPILEKIGLNEHEINEELARIKLKDFDNMSATTVSEFDAKINKELSKLSLTDDVDQIDMDEIMSDDYLDTREALIDRKINEELAKLLANYEESSPPSANQDKRSSSQNVSDAEGLDLTSISTNVFSYKSSNDSIDTRSELGSMQEPAITTEKYPQYTENILPFSVSKYEDQNLSPKSDIDIYRELEKLEKISSAQVLPDSTLEMPQKELSPIPYVSNVSPYAEISPLRYAGKSAPYSTSPLNSSYDPYKTFDFKSKLSPRKAPSNPYTTVPFDKPIIDTTFDLPDHKVPLNAYDLHLKSPILTKESLEFRVRYDDESPRQPGREYMPRHTNSKSIINANKEASYFNNNGNKPVTPTVYLPKEDRKMDSGENSFLDYSTGTTDILHRKYGPLSPKDYIHGPEYNRHLASLGPLESGTETGSYLPTRPDYNPLSPNRQVTDPQFRSTMNHYVSKLSPCMDETKRPVSHPEYPGKLNVGKYVELPEKGTSCYKKSSLSLGNIGHSNKTIEEECNQFTSPSPKMRFSPFPIRNAPRKPKELALKLGLYSPNDLAQSKRS